jgi:DNA-binding XRE family transcriptional regulator
MKTNMGELRRKIVEAGTTQEGLADSLGIARSTLYRKMKTGGRSFSIAEAQRIADCLGLTSREAANIFLIE